MDQVQLQDGQQIAPVDCSPQAVHLIVHLTGYMTVESDHGIHRVAHPLLVDSSLPTADISYLSLQISAKHVQQRSPSP